MSQLQAEAKAPGGATTEADEFSALLKQNFKPRSERAETEIESAVSTLVKQALADQSVVKDDVLDTIEEMIARLDEKLSIQVNEIIHADEFQKLEAAWRGLYYLTNHSETDATLKLRVMNITKQELYKEARAYPDAKWDQSPLFKKIYEAEFGQLGGQPFGAMVMDYHFDHSAPDVTIMKSVAKIGAAAHCMMIAGAGPTLLGMDSWTELSNPRDLSKIFETPDYAAWKSLRDSENTRYLGLCMPRVLSREPYGAKTLPVEEFAFEERTDGHKGKDYAWMNAAYAMAANINRAFKEYGWTIRIRGVQSGGEVMDLPVHTFPADDGSVDQKCPTEIAITDRREAELSKSGLLPLIHRKNTDKAAFIGAQSVYKPKAYLNPDATASDNLSSRIPYMFAISRFSHYLKVMVRDWIGESYEREELQRRLTEWISQYVLSNPGTAGESLKAQKPLAEARVDVFADEENPGYYGARFYIRPHFQLEGMDIGMSLVSRLPAKAG
jgi:type VI secretion system protein ImpC